MNNLLKGKVFASIQRMNDVWLAISLTSDLLITIEGGFEFYLNESEVLTSEQYMDSNFSLEIINHITTIMKGSCITEVKPNWESGNVVLVFSNGGRLKMFPEDELLDAWAIKGIKGTLYEVSGNRGIQSY